MKQYRHLLEKVLLEGEVRRDRTGTGTKAIFGGHLEFDLRERFPLVTLKETRYKVAFLEMLWFLRGEDTTKWLNDHNCKLWDAWADEEGHLGPIYGVQWRRWDNYAGGEVDQIKQLIEGLKASPGGRRHLVSAWNVPRIKDMGLPPCHWSFQCYASNDGHLDMMVHMRSWDLGLGAPFNIAQYALLVHLIARATGLKPRWLKFTYGDAHVYNDHVPQLKAMLESRSAKADGARLVINTSNTDIDGYKPEDFAIEGYDPHPHIPLKVSV